jgi:zinc transport system substrate-binding protein
MHGLLNRIGRGLILLLVLLLIAAAVGCSAAGVARDDGKISVAATFYPLYDFARKIGGDHVRVTNLVPAGVEPHDWSPKPQDMVKMTEADVFIYNGWGFEGWADDFLRGLKEGQGPVIVEAVRGIEPMRIAEASPDETHDDEHDGHAHTAIDPHVWMSPLQAVRIAENILEGLAAADPEHQADYQNNFAAFKAELNDLHKEYEKVIGEAERKDIVVSHHAYAYLTRDYGLRQIAVMGLSPDAEPTPQALKRISEYVREHEVKYILFEELASPKLAETLAKDAGVETLVFHPLEGLTPEQEKRGEDYFTLMRANLETLRKALQ